VTNPYDNDRPELGSIAIRVYPPIGSGGFAAAASTTAAPSASINVAIGAFSSLAVEYSRFLSYEYDQHYLTPCDQWHFSLPVGELADSDRSALVPGAKVEVLIDGNVQSIGYIDDVQVTGARSSGSIMLVTGRDWMSPAVDSQVDPTARFSDGQTLDQLLQTVFAPFGMQVLETSAIADTNAITGRIFGSPTTKKGKALKSYVLHQIKPYQMEGAYAFASRVAQRFGLWLRPAVDGKTIVCAVPDFDQASRYQLLLKTDGSQSNNVLDWHVTKSRADQPSILFASGFGGGGDFARSTLRGAILNPLIALADPNVVTELLAAYPGIICASPPTPAIVSGVSALMLEPFARPQYLYDSESKDPAQLRTYLQRELSLRMRKSLTAKYAIVGHKLGGQPIAVNTMVDVDDDVSNLHGPMWIQSRKFSKESPTSGTTTTLEAIRPGTLLLGPGTTQ
jgi:prophage tail gpP-like protein